MAIDRVVIINPRQKKYPRKVLAFFGKNQAPPISVLGNPDLLDVALTGLFCSKGYISSLLLPAHDIVAEIRDLGKATIGGFHSPMEQELLSILLRGNQPIVMCLARSKKGIKIPFEWEKALLDGRMAIVSPFSESETRVTKERALYRNRFVASLSHEILVVYSSPDGMVKSICAEAKSEGIPIRILNHPVNKHLIDEGFESITIKEYTARERGASYGKKAFPIIKKKTKKKE